METYGRAGQRRKVIDVPLLLCNVRALLGRDAATYRVEVRDILVRGSRIDSVAVGGSLDPEPGWEVIDGEGLLATPGLVNAHTHSPLNVLRGTTDRMDHVDFMWANQRDTAGRSDEEIYASAALGALDMLRQGVTAIVDHFPEQNCTLDQLPPAIRAYTDVGLRAVLALRVFDGAYDDIGDDQTGGKTLAPAPADELIARCAEAVDRWHGQDGLISIFPGPSNPMRCSDDLLTGCHALAEARDVGLHTHLLETRVQQDLAQEANGTSMVAHLSELGILDRRWSFAHAVWVTGDDIALLAESRAVVVHNPHSNSKLGVGVAPIVDMMAAGVPIALGTDGASTNDTLSLHETMALAALLPRITGTDRARWPGSGAVLEMALAGGARVVDPTGATGEIAEGQTADLALYDLDAPPLAPLNDPVQQLVFSERGGSVRTTIVNGRTVYSDGQFAARGLDDVVARARAIRAGP